ncbi:glycosyltransferase [Arthrobacter globiformis]|uniref:glycosyltransferase n=1 Tax=Arthrobacter globiformis TaxID=1665 RepID=UPI001FDF6A1B|nr:glycosyltransferase [Arthrobacter globiformis]
MKKSPLKITILGLHYSPEPSGNAPYTTSLAEGLSAKGHDVRVLTGYPHYPGWRVHPGFRGWSQAEVMNGIRVKRLRHHVPHRPTGLKRLHMELSFGLRLLFSRWEQPDVVVLVSPALFSTAIALVRARFGARRPATAVWVQDLYSRGLVETGQASGLGKLAARVEAGILGMADGVVAIHERFARHIVDELGLSPQDVQVIRNWTHLPTPPETDRLATRKSLGWLDEETIVLHAGNMGKKQGLENVVAAAKHASLIGSSTRFVLMGDGNQRPALMRSGQGIANLTFIDPLPQAEFQAALSAADVLTSERTAGCSRYVGAKQIDLVFQYGSPRFGCHRRRQRHS